MNLPIRLGSDRPLVPSGRYEWTGGVYVIATPAEHCPPPVGDWRESLAERPAP